MNNSLILVINCGSSSIKFAVFNAEETPLSREALCQGKVVEIGSNKPQIEVNNQEAQDITIGKLYPYSDAIEIILEKVKEQIGDSNIIAISHRVVHGGSKYFQPVLINSQILNDLKAYIPLAPLHQPFALDAIQNMLEKHPELPQIACFDTAFHHTVPDVEKTLPLPYDAWERGLRRYGFHGLSYEFISTVLPEKYGDLSHKKVIVAHLGSGASLCGMENLQSQATTMGFSALDGLMMGTRTGSLDPGAVIYLMEIEKLSLEEVGQILYHNSGLKGISGISSDPRLLFAAEHENHQAKLALDLYVRRIIREIGAITAIMGGVDMIVFTAGVGERSSRIRERVCDGLSWLGIDLDHDANEVDSEVISKPDSKIKVVVQPTNEEWVAALHAQKLMDNINS